MINSPKIFIIDNSHKLSKKITDNLCNLDDNIIQARRFTSDDSIKYNEYTYYLEPEYILNGYKNHSFVFINIDKANIYTGIAIDEMYNSDILILDICEFNNISNSIFKRNDILVIWIDDIYKNQQYQVDFSETKYLIERLEKVNYMYFYKEDPNVISDLIYEYINSDQDNRKKMLKNIHNI